MAAAEAEPDVKGSTSSSLWWVVSSVSPWVSGSLSDSSTMECSGSTLLGRPLSPLGPSRDERSRLAAGRTLEDDDDNADAADAGGGLKGGILLWIPVVVLRDDEAGVKEWWTDAAALDVAVVVPEVATLVL